MSVTIANPIATTVAISFVVITFALLLLLLISWIVCCCWKYKLHKRKQELKSRDFEQGIYTLKHKQKPCACCGCGYSCCGCWSYTCRSCSCCCEQSDVVQQVVPVADVSAPAGPSFSSGGAQFGWSKDVYVYNTGPAKIASSSMYQPVSFSNRWSTGNDGRLILNGGGVVSRITSGPQTFGGIYSSMPLGISSGDQYQLRVVK